MIAALKCFTETLNRHCINGSCYYLVFKDRKGTPGNGRKYVIGTKCRDVNTAGYIFSSSRFFYLSDAILSYFYDVMSRAVKLKIHILDQLAIDFYGVLSHQPARLAGSFGEF